MGKRIQKMKKFFMLVPAVFSAICSLFLQQWRGRDLSWEGGSVLPNLQAGSGCSLCCQGRGCGSVAPVLQREVVNGNKLQNWKLPTIKHTVTSRKQYGFSQGQIECNNTGTLPNIEGRSLRVAPLRKQKCTLCMYLHLQCDTPLFPAQESLGIPITKQLLFSASAASSKPRSRCPKQASSSVTGLGSPVLQKALLQSAEQSQEDAKQQQGRHAVSL